MTDDQHCWQCSTDTPILIGQGTCGVCKVARGERSELKLKPKRTNKPVENVPDDPIF